MTTPNMNLVELVPGSTTGPQYATDIVNNFSTIDDHDHTTGNGVRIPSAGININADLPFMGNAPTGQGKSQFNSLGSALSAAGDYRSVHVVNGELYYLDNSGNSVQITSSGSVAGSAGNITGLSSPASVTFSTNKYVFKDTANSFAIMESSDVRLFEDSASAISNYVALKSPAALASTYSLTMPAALPGADTYVQSSSSGVLSFVSADDIGDAMTATGANAIIDVYTRPTGSTVAVRGVARSTPTATASTGLTTFQDVLDNTGSALSVTITTSGRPVVIGIICDESINDSFIAISHGDTIGQASGTFLVLKDASGFTEFNILSTSAANTATRFPPPSIIGIDTPSAGTYTYALQFRVDPAGSSGETIQMRYCRMVAFEL